MQEQAGALARTVSVFKLDHAAARPAVAAAPHARSLPHASRAYRQEPRIHAAARQAEFENLEA
jgi:hypothetical protein